MNHPILFIIYSLRYERKGKVDSPVMNIYPSWISQENLFELFEFKLEVDTREKDNLLERIKIQQNEITKLLSENTELIRKQSGLYASSRHDSRHDSRRQPKRNMDRRQPNPHHRIKVLHRELERLQDCLNKLPIKKKLKDRNDHIIKSLPDFAISIYENYHNIYDINMKDTSKFIFKLKKTHFD